ncbi:MAG: hypothetical protein LQ339_002122 [Xanthoria mediterranea]|nr:MAG: hypothetical protein LQ339_002122 [Xanthoria mediterranea]
MSSRGSSSGETHSEEHLPVGVIGGLDNGHRRDQGSHVKLERNDRHAQIPRPLDNIAAPRQDTARFQSAFGVYQAPGSNDAYVEEMTEDENKNLDELTEDRDNASIALERAQRRLDEAHQRVNQRLQCSRVLGNSSNARSNQQLRPSILGTGTNSRFTTSSYLGKRRNNERDENDDENGSLQTGSRTKRPRNAEHTTEFSGPPHISSGNALRSLQGLGRRRRHLHPSSSIRPSVSQAKSFHQASTQSDASLYTPDRAEASQVLSNHHDPTSQSSQLEPDGVSAYDGDGEEQQGLGYQVAQTQDLQHLDSSGYVADDQEWFDELMSLGQQPCHSTSGAVTGFRDTGAANTYDNLDLQDQVQNPFSTGAPTRQLRKPRGHRLSSTPITGKRSRDNSDTTHEGFGNGDEGPNDPHSDGPPNEMPPTKRQKKRLALAAEGKDIPKDDEKVKGIVEKDQDGNLFHLHQGTWEPAAYHEDRRAGLLARAAAKGTYTYPPNAGTKELDRTSFHPLYANINMNVREGRPHLLYQWDPPKEQTPYVHPGLMRDPEDGILLLDKNNHAILDWPQLPTTISAQVDGFWLEFFYRLNRHIRIEDVLARCPSMTQRKDSTLYRAIPTRSAYGNSRSKDRLATGTRSWEQKEGSKEIKARYERIMPNKVLAEIAHRGTTTFFRDLSPKETSAICHINRGKGTAPSRAGNKKLGEKEKKERKAKSDLELERIYRRLLQEKHDADQSDLRWAQEGGPDPGFAFPDPATGTAQLNAETTVRDGHLINTQIPGPANNTPFLENEGDTTLVEEDPAANHGFGQSYPSTQSNHGYGDVQGSTAQQNTIGNSTGLGPGFYWLAPKTPQDKAHLKDALENACQACRVMTGDDPPPTNENECYMNQFRGLEEWLESKLSSTDPGKPIPVLLPHKNWYLGGWGGWNRMASNYTSGGDSHSTHTDDPFEYDLATAKDDPDSKATTGAPPGYVAAELSQHGFGPDRPLLETPVIQQPNPFDDPQYQMVGSPTLSQDEDAPFDPTQLFGPPDPEFEHFMSSISKKEASHGNYSLLLQ